MDEDQILEIDNKNKKDNLMQRWLHLTLCSYQLSIKI